MEVSEHNRDISTVDDTSSDICQQTDDPFAGEKSPDKTTVTSCEEAINNHSEDMEVSTPDSCDADPNRTEMEHIQSPHNSEEELPVEKSPEKMSSHLPNQPDSETCETDLKDTESSQDDNNSEEEASEMNLSEKISSLEPKEQDKETIETDLKDTESPREDNNSEEEAPEMNLSEKTSSPEPKEKDKETIDTDLKVARIVDGSRVSFISPDALLRLIMKDQVVLFVFQPNSDTHEVLQIRRDENFDEESFHTFLSEIDRRLESGRRKRKFSDIIPKQENLNSSFEGKHNKSVESTDGFSLKKVKLEPVSDDPDDVFTRPLASSSVEDVVPENIQCEPSVSCLISDDTLENSDDLSTCKPPWNASPRKQQFCPFCKQMTSTFSRHLGRVHREENEVKELLKLPALEKQAALRELRTRGNNELEAMSPGQVTKRKMPNDRCTFCGLKTTSLMYHLTKYHFEEEVVIKLRSCPADSTERKEIMADLRFAGQCIAPVVPEEPASPVYVACPVCKKLFNSHGISRHTKKCSAAKPPKKVKKKIVVNVPEKYKSLTPLLSSLKDDITTAYLLTDECILYLAQQWIEKFPVVRVGHATVKSNIRKLAQLVLDANKLSSQVSELKDLFQVRHFDLFKSCVLSADKNGESNDQNSTPKLSRHFDVLMMHCYKHLRVKFLEEKESLVVKELDDWYYLYRSEFKSTATKGARKSFSDSLYENSMNDSLNSSSSNNVPDSSVPDSSQEHRSSYFTEAPQKVASLFSKWTPKPKITYTMNLKRGQICSLTEDIQRLNEFLKSEIERCMKSLEASFNFNDWVTLTEVVLVRFMLYNHKKVSHCEIFLLSGLEQRQKIEKDSEIYNLLSVLEKIISEKVMSVKLTPPGAAESYLLLDNLMASAMEVIVKHRLQAGVEKDNPCTFGEGEVDYFSVKESLNDVVHKAKLTNPEILMKVAVQNYMAAVTKTADLTEKDLVELRSQLGHTSEKYEDFYKVPTETDHLVQISLLILEMDDAGNEEIQKVSDSDILTNCDEVELSGEGESEVIGERVEASELSYNPFQVSALASTPGSRRAHGKKKWSASEKRRMRQLFSEYINKNELPSLPCCEMMRNRYIELRNRTPEQIKACVYNETVRVKRNQKTEWFR